MMEGWKHIEIGKLILNSKLKDPLKYHDVEFRYVDVSSVSNTLFKIEDVTILKGRDAPSRARKLINYEDVIFATVRPTLMRIAIVPKDLDGEICSTGYCVLKPNKNLIHPLFLYYSLLPDFFIDRISKLQRGASYPAIRDTDLKSQIISLPPLSEQQKISHILNTVQQAIEKHEQLIRTTTELKKALMQKLFTEGLYSEPQKETEIGLVPESWEVVQIKDVYRFTSKPKGLKDSFPVPFIPMEIVPLNEIYIKTYELRDNVTSGTYVENGDLLLAKITPSFENGKQGILQIDKDYSYATTEVIPIKEIEGISDKYYLFYFLLKDDVRIQLTDKMEGSTGRQRLSKAILENAFIPKPTFKEQKEIANIFIAFDNRMSYYHKKKQTLSSLFKNLLHQLMTGQIRVHEIEFDKYEVSETEELSLAAEGEAAYETK